MAQSKLCFVIGPIGSHASDDRIHADKLLKLIIKPTFSSTLPISGSVTKRIRESPQERGGNLHISPVMPGHR
jgi:hypothetical protein